MSIFLVDKFALWGSTQDSNLIISCLLSVSVAIPQSTVFFPR